MNLTEWKKEIYRSLSDYSNQIDYVIGEHAYSELSETERLRVNRAMEEITRELARKG